VRLAAWTRGSRRSYEQRAAAIQQRRGCVNVVEVKVFFDYI